MLMIRTEIPGRLFVFILFEGPQEELFQNEHENVSDPPPTPDSRLLAPEHVPSSWLA